MKTVACLVNALETLFQATNIGAYFAPIFRPMVTEQDRLHRIRVTPLTVRAGRLQNLFDWPTQP